MQVNTFEAKTYLSKYLRLLSEGKESYIIIANNGTPVAKLIPFTEDIPTRKIGAAKGKVAPLPDLDLFNKDNELIAESLREGSV